MKSLKDRKRDRRGIEIRHLVPEMLEYVSEHYEPLVQYCIDTSHIRYSLPMLEDETAYQPAEPAPKVSYSIRTPSYDQPVIDDMKKFTQEAKKNMAMYDSPALEKTYHVWEKENSEYKSFSSEVVRMVKERCGKPSEFYHAAGIDKRTWHKISTDYGYKPSRQTAFRCCIGLRLGVGEAEDLLKLAGMAFSPNDPDDLVLKFCLAKGIRDIPGINYMLYRYATRSLSPEDEGMRKHESMMRAKKDREEKQKR